MSIPNGSRLVPEGERYARASLPYPSTKEGQRGAALAGKLCELSKKPGKRDMTIGDTKKLDDLPMACNGNICITGHENEIPDFTEPELEGL
ncbi:MAG: hypothetical protein ACO1N5_18725 [Noviherbaspirillum sp.]